MATPDLADLAARARVVGVEAHLRGQVEGDGEAGLALPEQERKRSLDSSAVPKPAYWRIVHGRPRYIVGCSAARERESPGLTDARGIGLARPVDRLDLDARGRVPLAAHASAPTSTTIFPRCAFSRIIWCG